MSNATDIQSGLGALATPPRKSSELDPAAPAAPIPATRARATAIPPKQSGGGGGIASPLTETETPRTYHAARNVTSVDGFIVFRVAPLASLSMTDANGAAVVFSFADVAP